MHRTHRRAGQESRNTFYTIGKSPARATSGYRREIVSSRAKQPITCETAPHSTHGWAGSHSEGENAHQGAADGLTVCGFGSRRGRPCRVGLHRCFWATKSRQSLCQFEGQGLPAGACMPAGPRAIAESSGPAACSPRHRAFPQRCECGCRGSKLGAKKLFGGRRSASRMCTAPAMLGPQSPRVLSRRQGCVKTAPEGRPRGQM